MVLSNSFIQPNFSNIFKSLLTISFFSFISFVRVSSNISSLEDKEAAKTDKREKDQVNPEEKEENTVKSLEFMLKTMSRQILEDIAEHIQMGKEMEVLRQQVEKNTMKLKTEIRGQQQKISSKISQ